MKYCLVADDGQARVVTHHNTLRRVTLLARMVSGLSRCKWHVCRREPSHNGFKLITLETWEKGQKV